MSPGHNVPSQLVFGQGLLLRLGAAVTVGQRLGVRYKTNREEGPCGTQRVRECRCSLVFQNTFKEVCALDNNTHPSSASTLCVSARQDDFGIFETNPVITFTQGFNCQEHPVTLGVLSSHSSCMSASWSMFSYLQR